MRLFLDTNSLLCPVMFKIDIFSELELLLPNAEIIVPEEVIKELKKIIVTKKNKYKNAAKIGLQIVEKKKIRIMKLSNGESYVDSILVNNLEKGDYVFTNDTALKHKLKEKGIKIVALKAKKFLFIDEY